MSSFQSERCLFLISVKKWKKLVPPNLHRQLLPASYFYPKYCFYITLKHSLRQVVLYYKIKIHKNTTFKLKSMVFGVPRLEKSLPLWLV